LDILEQLLQVNPDDRTSPKKLLQNKLFTSTNTDNRANQIGTFGRDGNEKTLNDIKNALWKEIEEMRIE